jgi:uncharacterized membrane protein
MALPGELALENRLLICRKTGYAMMMMIMMMVMVMQRKYFNQSYNKKSRKHTLILKPALRSRNRSNRGNINCKDKYSNQREVSNCNNKSKGRNHKINGKVNSQYGRGKQVL